MKAQRVLFVTNWAYYEPFVGVPGVRWAFDLLARQGIGYRNQWLAVNRGVVPDIDGVLPETIEPGPMRALSTKKERGKGRARVTRQHAAPVQQRFVVETDEE
jgi:hypothetical protein